MSPNIVRIGNSQGVRIPKVLLDRSGLTDEVEIDAERDQIIIRPVRQPREGWAHAFRQMADIGDDQPVDGDLVGQTGFDRDEWQW